MQRFKASSKDVRKRIESGEITYVGRKFAGLDASPLGNPFKAKKDRSDVDDVLLKYRKHLFAKIKLDDGEVLKALLEVYFSRKVACWCELDEKCHADVVCDAAEWLWGGDFLARRIENGLG